jgi:hypothetical protein
MHHGFGLEHGNLQILAFSPGAASHWIAFGLIGSPQIRSSERKRKGVYASHASFHAAMRVFNAAMQITTR